MRVLLYQFFPGGGIGRYTHELASHLMIQPGIDLSVVCSPDFEWLEHAEYDVRPLLPSLRHSNPALRRVRFGAAQFEAPRRLFRLAREESADVIHFSNINHISYPFWRRWIPDGICIAATAHDVKRATSMVSKRWEDSSLKAFYRRADALFVHSELQSEELREWADCDSGRISIVPHGIYNYPDAAGDQTWCRRRLGLPEDAPLGLFFGHVRDEKNLQSLIEAMADPRTCSHLLVAGRGGARGHRSVADYRQAVNDLGLRHRVHFLEDYIAEDEVGQVFTACDWVSLAYRSAFSSQSGVLNVAMYFKRPVITTPAPTLSHTAAKFKIGVQAKDDEAAGIAGAVALMESQLRSRTVFQFEEYAAHYNWQENACRTRARYEHVAQSA